MASTDLLLMCEETFCTWSTRRYFSLAHEEALIGMQIPKKHICLDYNVKLKLYTRNNVFIIGLVPASGFALSGILPLGTLGAK